MEVSRARKASQTCLERALIERTPLFEKNTPAVEAIRELVVPTKLDVPHDIRWRFDQRELHMSCAGLPIQRLCYLYAVMGRRIVLRRDRLNARKPRAAHILDHLRGIRLPGNHLRKRRMLGAALFRRFSERVARFYRVNPIEASRFRRDVEREVSPRHSVRPEKPAASAFLIGGNAWLADPRLGVAMILVIGEDSFAVFLERLVRVGVSATQLGEKAAGLDASHPPRQSFRRHGWIALELDLPHRRVRPIVDLKADAYRGIRQLFAEDSHVRLRVPKFGQRRLNRSCDALQNRWIGGHAQARRGFLFGEHFLNLFGRKQSRAGVIHACEEWLLFDLENQPDAQPGFCGCIWQKPRILRFHPNRSEPPETRQRTYISLQAPCVQRLPGSGRNLRFERRPRDSAQSDKHDFLNRWRRCPVT